jgi:hypothetical protein
MKGSLRQQIVRRLYVSIGPAISDTPHARRGNSVSPRQRAIGNSLVASENIPHLIVRELSATGVADDTVFESGKGLDVLRIDTPTILAAMVQFFPFGNGTVNPLIVDDVCPTGIPVNRGAAIPVLVDISLPLPARGLESAINDDVLHRRRAAAVADDVAARTAGNESVAGMGRLGDLGRLTATAHAQAGRVGIGGGRLRGHLDDLLARSEGCRRPGALLRSRAFVLPPFYRFACAPAREGS